MHVRSPTVMPASYQGYRVLAEAAPEERQQLDDSRPGNDLPVTGRDLRAAVQAVLAGRPYTGPQKPSQGCSIKWKPGNEPEWLEPSVDWCSRHLPPVPA